MLKNYAITSAEHLCKSYELLMRKRFLKKIYDTYTRISLKFYGQINVSSFLAKFPDVSAARTADQTKVSLRHLHVQLIIIAINFDYAKNDEKALLFWRIYS
jgi:hypothetical protein